MLPLGCKLKRTEMLSPFRGYTSKEVAMSRKIIAMLAGMMVLSLVLAACGGAAAPTAQQGTAAPAAQQGGGERTLEIYHWWTAPGEREAADAMFKALKDKY